MSEFFAMNIESKQRNSMKLVWDYDDESINWAQLSELYRIAPLGYKPEDVLKMIFSNSRYKCFIFDEARLVGAGRALSDGLDCSYICDIAVHPQYQGIGLGKAIVEKLVTLSDGHKKIILYAKPGKERFYSKLGFKKMETAMAIFLDQKYAIETGLIREEV
jgi:ribosomal protein S18 acetylase RimI-like enzyme